MSSDSNIPRDLAVLGLAAPEGRACLAACPVPGS